MLSGFPLRPAVIALTTVAAGCGGGGASAPAITASNAASIARAVVNGISTADVLGGTLEEQARKPFEPFIVTIGAPASTLKVTEAQPTAAQVPTSGTRLCSDSGSLALTADFASETTVLPGDTYALNYENCVETEFPNIFGTLSDGRLSFAVGSFSGNIETGEFAMSVDIDTSNFTRALGGFITFDGSAGLVFTGTPLNTAELTLTLANMRVTTNSVRNNEFRNLQINSSFQDLGYRLTVDGEIGAQSYSGLVGVATPVALFTPFNGSAPSSGPIVLSGNQSTLAIDVLDANNVELELDTNGDGQVDEVIPTNWQTLTGIAFN